MIKKYLFLCFIIALIFTGCEKKPATTNDSVIPENLVQYTHPNNYFSIMYPGNWKSEEDGVFVSDDMNVVLSYNSFVPTLDGLTPEKLEEYLLEFKEYFSGYLQYSQGEILSSGIETIADYTVMGVSYHIEPLYYKLYIFLDFEKDLTLSFLYSSSSQENFDLNMSKVEEILNTIVINEVTPAQVNLALDSVDGGDRQSVIDNLSKDAGEIVGLWGVVDENGEIMPVLDFKEDGTYIRYKGADTPDTYISGDWEYAQNALTMGISVYVDNGVATEDVYESSIYSIVFFKDDVMKMINTVTKNLVIYERIKNE